MAETTAQDFANALAQAAQQPAAPPAATAVASASAATASIVDFDAGGGWGADTVSLAHPFKTAGVTYSVLRMRVPTGVDVTRFYSSAQRSSIIDFALGLLSNDNGPIDARVFGLMHASDSAAIIAKASGFLGGSPQT